MGSDPKRFQQTEKLFHEILALPPADRPAALDKACAGDAAWRQELEQLIAHASSEREAMDLTASLRMQLADPLPDQELGRMVGPYRIQRRIGAGGMGGVYLAKQEEPVRRNVAIKFIKRGLDSEETLRRFQNERQVLAALNHPNIAQLYDGGSTGDGRPYFVMEYVEGEPIDAYCDRHKFTTTQRLKLFQQVCGAVHFLHQNTIVHRDLKPANIQVSTKGAPKLLDFGIAKLIQADGRSPDTTRTDQRFMTMQYASPEQVRGDIITTSSDIYSLGVVLYELLTGHRPYETGVMSDREIEHALRSDNDPTKPSEVIRRKTSVRRRGSITELTPDAVSRVRGASADRLARLLKGDLDNIVLKALRKEPDRRYVSAEQLAADIERHLRNEPIVAASPGFLYHANKFARRNKVACLLLLALLLGLGGSIAGAVMASRARDRALLAERQSQQQAGQLQRAVYVREMTLASVDFRGSAIASARRRLREVPPALRDWEWRYLNSTCEDSVHVCEGHQGPVVTVAASPDGRLGASGGTDGTVRIWDLESGIQRHELRGHQTPVRSIAFNPKTGQLASGGDDGTVRVWEPQKGAETSSLKPAGGAVLSLRYNADGRWLAIGTEDQTIRLWDTTTGGFVRTLEGYDGKSDSMSFTLDSRTIVAGGKEGVPFLWDVATGTPRHLHQEAPFAVAATAFSPDGKHVVVSTLNSGLRIYDAATWSRQRAIPGDSMTKSTLTFSADSRRIIACAREPTTIRFIDVADRKTVRAYRGHQGPILALAVTPDNKWLISGAGDGTVRIWHGSPEPSILRQPTNAEAILALAFSPDGRTFVTSGHDGTITFWDPCPRTPLRQLRPNTPPATCLSFSRNGAVLASGQRNGRLITRDGATATQKWGILAHTGELTCLAFAPDDSWIVTGGQDGYLRMWETATGKEIRSMTAHQGGIATVAVAPHDPRVFGAGTDGQIRIWDGRSGIQLNTIRGHNAAILNIAISPNSARLVSAGADGNLRLWELSHGQPRLLTSRTLESPVLWIAFSPDGSRFVTTGDDNTLRLWDSETGTEILIFHEHRQKVTCAAFSPDGTTLVSAGFDRFLVTHECTSYPERRAARRRSVEIQATANLLVTGLRNELGDWDLIGESIRNDPELPQPIRSAALNQVLVFAETKSVTPADWDVRFFAWGPTTQPAEIDSRWTAARDGADVVRCRRRVIDFDWDKHAPAPKIPREYFGMIATGTVTTPAGRHVVETYSDDGVRVTIDGRRIIDNWTQHAPTLDKAELQLTQGPHTVVVEYYQLGGAAKLRLSLDPLPRASQLSGTTPNSTRPSASQPAGPGSAPAIEEDEPDEPADDETWMPSGV